MIGAFRFEPPDRFIFDGYPEGTRICQLGIPDAEELRRLFLYQRDLQQSAEWLEDLAKLPENSSTREALAIAALIRLCGCFESTSGHRRQPLKQSKVFKGANRAVFAEIKRLRNKLIVHDEQLYPTHMSWVAIGPNGKAIEAGVIGMSFGLTNMKQLSQLGELTQAALAWTTAEFEMMAKRAADFVNALPPEDVLKEAALAGPIRITINAEE